MVVLHNGKHIKDRKPSQVLQSVQRQLAGYRTGVRRNGQAVTLSYETWPDVDIVPVSRVTNSSGNISHYNVPDMNREVWIKSKPRLHDRYMTDKNKECGDAFKRIVKMIK
jgi:Second Messenger Oligonucleotide or Dinucleotide Synthetase domain